MSVPAADPRAARAARHRAGADAAVLPGARRSCSPAAGWIPRVAPLEHKAELARTAWESALAADALRERVFELRYPVAVPRRAGRGARRRDAGRPARAGRASCATTTPPTSTTADELADGPSIRIVEPALRDKERQVEALAGVDARRERPRARPALLRLELLLARRRSTRTTRTARASRSRSARRSAT